MAETAKKAAPAPKEISIPAFEQKLKLNTLQAQKVMRRVFSRAAGSLYRTDVILRIIGGDKEAEQVEMVINTMIKEVEDGLQETQKEMAELLEENGVDELPVYDSPTEETVRITSPHVARFVSLVRKLDALIVRIDAMWLSGLMTNKDRNDAVYRWQQKVIGLGSRIIGLERRARLAARKKGKGEEVDAQAPEAAEEAKKEGDEPSSETEVAEEA
jgi:hypothetical protein